MKTYLFALPLLLFMQTGSCDDDSDTTSDDSSSNFVTFLGETNDAFGGCNVESTDDDLFICVYNGGYNANGQGFTIAVSHTGLCRTASFTLDSEATNDGEAQFIIQISESGVAVETFVGVSGTVNVSDSGVNSSIEFNGTVVSLTSGEEETISGFIECGL